MRRRCQYKYDAVQKALVYGTSNPEVQYYSVPNFKVAALHNIAKYLLQNLSGKAVVHVEW